MSILIAILGLAALIVIHEGGHFLVARLCGMRVERFSVGFGNPLVSFKKGDTVYQIAPIPLGGFVQITGLNPHEEFDHNDPYVYPNRPRWMRLAVLLAGPGANYLAACLLALGLFVGYGKMVASVGGTMAGSAAEAAGLKAGDKIVEIQGKPLPSVPDVSGAVRRSAGAPVHLKIERPGAPAPLEFQVTPRRGEKGELLMGVQLGQSRTPVPTTHAVKEAILLPATMSVEFLKGIYEMIAGKTQASLTGPVGIAREMAKAADKGLLDFVWLVMVLSVYLGLFNLLPLPALDGGRALFLAIGALRIRVSARAEAAVHMVGLVLLLGVFVLVTFKDIKQLVVGLVN